MGHSEKPVLITGGAGFIGSHMACLLSGLNIDLIVLDNLSSGTLENLPTNIRQNNFIYGDASDPVLLASLVKDSSIVIHFASVVGMRAVVKNPLGVIDTNVYAVKVLAELCSEYDIPLVFISTSAVYGGSGVSELCKCESDQVHVMGHHPASLYVEAKMMGESICEIYKRTHGLKYLIIRPFNMIGPRQTSAYGMVVPSFIRSALAGNKLYIHGDGTQTRTFSDVRIAVRLLWDLIKNERSYNKIFNLATTEREISILELAETICTLTGSRPGFVFSSYESEFGENFCDIKKRAPSLLNLREYTGYGINSSLEECLTDIVEHEKQSMYCEQS